MTTTPLPTLRWQPVRTAPTLAADALHLWLIPLDGAAALADETCAAMLSHPQRARAARLRDPQRRLYWMRSQAGCRGILAHYIGVAPGRIAFRHGPAGKPEIDGDGPAFNLTNTGDLALLAVSGGAAVGVDCELLRARGDLAGVARRMLGAELAERLARMPEPQARQVFYRHWTALEARVKADGRGLAGHRDPDPPGLAVLHAGPRPDAVCAVARVGLPPVADWVTLTLAAAVASGMATGPVSAG